MDIVRIRNERLHFPSFSHFHLRLLCPVWMPGDWWCRASAAGWQLATARGELNGESHQIRYWTRTYSPIRQDSRIVKFPQLLTQVSFIQLNSEMCFLPHLSRESNMPGLCPARLAEGALAGTCTAVAWYLWFLCRHSVPIKKVAAVVLVVLV